MASRSGLVQFLILASVATMLLLPTSRAHALLDWDSRIPAAPENVLEVLAGEAMYYSFETDDGVCGGEISNPEVINYSTAQTDDGLTVHNVQLSIHVSKAINYCQSEQLYSCKIDVEILPDSSITVPRTFMECAAL